MAKVFIEESTLTSIGDAIRSKTGKTELIDPVDMGAEITSISGSAKKLVERTATSITEEDLQGIEKIGDYAFYNYDTLESVEIPNNITSIGAGAFMDCDSLTSIEIPDSVTSIGRRAFDSCDSLTSITIPDSVTSIGGDAFYNCPIENATIPTIAISSMGTAFHKPELKTVVITGGESIENGAFENCTNLETLSIPFVGESADGASHFGHIFGAKSRYENENYIPASLKTVKITGNTPIDDGAFYNCSSIEDLDMSESEIKKIGILSFFGCDNLTNVTLPEDIESVGIGAFYGCEKLNYTTLGNGKYIGTKENPYLYFVEPTSKTITSITIQEGCKIIGAGAFLGCVVLSSVTIPNTVIDIGDYAFRSCTALSTVSFASDSQLKNIGKEAFRGCKGVLSIGGIKTLNIPNSVEKIGRGAFRDCDNLTTLSIPFVGRSRAYNDRHSHFAYIFGADGFGGSSYVPSKLTTVYITDATQIGDNAFYNCSNIANIYLNCVDTLTHVGDDAFYGCDSLNYTNVGDFKYLGVSAAVYGEENFYFYCAGKVDSSLDGSIYESCKILGSGNYYGVEEIPNGVIDMASNLSLRDISDQTFTTTYKGLKYHGFPSNPYYRLCGWENSNSISSTVSIHPDCKYIDDHAFNNCTSLTSITFEGNNVKEIGEKSFYNCNGLTSIDLPASIERIGYGAFYECNNLKNIDLSKTNITQIPDQLFAACGTVYNLYLNEKIETIGEDAFGITLGGPLTIPKSVISIEKNAFKDFKVEYDDAAMVGNIYYTGTIDDWAQIEFGNAYSTPLRYAINPNIELFIDNKLVEDIKLDKAYKISDYAFYDYRRVKSVTIPDTVTSIGASAFENCFSLGTVTMGEKALFDIMSAISISGINLSELGITLDEDVCKIKDYAFYNTGLTEFTIPEGCKSIGKKAFNCTSGQTPTLQKITVKATTPPTLADNEVIPSSVTEIAVMPGTLDAYTTATYWSSHADKYKEI